MGARHPRPSPGNEASFVSLGSMACAAELVLRVAAVRRQIRRLHRLLYQLRSKTRSQTHASDTEVGRRGHSFPDAVLVFVSLPVEVNLSCRHSWMLRLGRSMTEKNVVGLSGLEPLTSALSGQRSNRLSYRPARDYFTKVATDSQTLTRLLVGPLRRIPTWTRLP